MFKTLPCKPGATNLIPGPERSHVPQEKYASAPELLKPMHPRTHILQQEKPPL